MDQNPKSGIQIADSALIILMIIVTLKIVSMLISRLRKGEKMEPVET